MMQAEQQQDPMAILDDLSQEELEALEEVAHAKREAERERREALGQVLVKHRDAAIKFRAASGIETQWAEDQAYYEGSDETNRSAYYKGATLDSPLIAKPKNKYRSTVFLNITRPYVETAASKVIEVLSPSDQPSWTLDPKNIPSMPESPNPIVRAAEAEQQAQSAGEPAPTEVPKTELELVVEAAKNAAEGARLWIEDKLSICDFQGQLRLLVDESSRLGTGAMRGPIPSMHRSRKSTVNPDGSIEVVVSENIWPASKRISIWDCYPDPACGDNIHNGQFFVEHDRMVEKQVRDLMDQPGYDVEALQFVIEQGPMQNSSSGMALAPHDSADVSAERYHVWYYTGFLKRDDVLAMSCACDESDEIKNVGVPVVITMINDTPVKAHLNPMADGRFPYNLMCWQAVAGSPFGIGVGRQIRSCQAILNSHVRAMMENAGLSSGPQIVLSSGSVTPADGSWEITPRKIWLLLPDADVQNINEAFNAFQIPSIQAELLQAIDFALKMAENVTGLPILLQGQQGPNGVPETVGGMQILVANASSLLRRMARIFDDFIIKPHISNYYRWMMDYAADESIKGDFEVIPLGSTALVARDQRNVFLTQVVPQMMADARYGIDPTRLFIQIAKINGMHDPETIRFTPKEMLVLSQQQSDQMALDPRIQVAQLTNQTRLQVAQMNNETDQLRVTRDTDRDTMYVQAESMRTQVTAETKMAELQMRERLAMLDYANKNNITLAQIKKELAVEAGRNDLARELASTPSTDKLLDHGAAGAMTEQMTANADNQVQPGASEPPGKAPSGMGFAL